MHTGRGTGLHRRLDGESAPPATDWSRLPVGSSIRVHRHRPPYVTPNWDTDEDVEELVRHLREAIDANPERGNMRFGTVRPVADEDKHGPGFVIVDEQDEPIVVIHTGTPASVTEPRDPYSREAVLRALQHARDRDAPLAGTVGTGRLVVFDVTPADREPLDHRSLTVAIDEGESGADRVLNEIEGLQSGENRWDPASKAFVERVRALHELLSTRLADGSVDDPAIANRVVGRRLVKIIATRMASRNDATGIFEEKADVTDPEPTGDGFGETLEPIVEALEAFQKELDRRNLKAFHGDVLGRVYEGIIPAARRSDMGEYYTPTVVCDLVSRLTVTDAGDAILDPACGSGSFLLGAQRRLSELHSHSGDGSRATKAHFIGIEPNPTPAQLTTINLAASDWEADPPTTKVRVEDFFDLGPDDLLDTTPVDGFDVIVGNPPYVRQEHIDDKDHVRNHLATETVDADDLSRRSDLYAYFLTHATQFLRDGGDLGFVTSDRWLDTRYGEDLQQFLLDNYAIRAVITFDRQVFDDALVDSSVLILRRETDPAKREAQVTRFLRVREAMGVEAIASLVEADHDPNRLQATDEYRLVTRRQAALHEERKWNVFFTAPPVYFVVAASPNTVDLSEVADVTYGVKTGANPFFVGRKDAMEDKGLEDYVVPLLKASGQVETIRVTEETADEWRILDVHDLVERALAATDGATDESPEERVKRWLADNGHGALLEYVRSGEAAGYHERSSIASRTVWFDLGELPEPRILSTMFTWRVHRVYWNEPGAATSDQFYYVDPKGDVDAEVLAGILNSRVVWLANELHGRRAGGEGMTRLQTKVYETERWPLPDPRTMAEDRRAAIRAAFRDLQKRERTVDETTLEATASERDALDRAVIPALGLDGDDTTVLKAVKRGLRAMVEMREEGAGERTAALIDRERGTNKGAETVEVPDVDRSQTNGDAGSR
ncbi:MAG: polypeptide subunit release factor methylase [Natrialbaceae archaeon]|jgi:methylase of polypeptide subunit release factors